VSIIERAADLLGSIERPNSKSSAPGELDPIERSVSESTERSRFPEASEFAAQLEAIERAVGESSERSRFPEARDLAAQSEAKGFAVKSQAKARPARPASRTTRTLRVDRDKLRRQSMITPDGGRTPNAESFRRIKRQILANVVKSRAGAPANLVMVTSALAGEGKTFCAINLAISIALEMDRTVLLVDADVAKPSVPQALGLEAEQGLMDVLLDRRIDLAEVLWNTDIGKLTLLPAGTAHQHATELLASDTMRALLEEMAGRYHDRIIIFDSPPLLAASEASALASQMGQIVMVAEAGRTTEAALKAALGRIESSKVTGLLLNKGQVPGRDYDYGGYG
jgi:protein-tyrosine kinase